jgi:hypothetical protein
MGEQRDLRVDLALAYLTDLGVAVRGQVGQLRGSWRRHWRIGSPEEQDLVILTGP